MYEMVLIGRTSFIFAQRHVLYINVSGHAGEYNGNLKNLKRTIYILTLLLLTTFIWVQIYRAQFLPYDENFGLLIMIFLISVALLVTGIILLIRKTKLVRQNLILTILFLIINSPVTIFLAVMEYEFIFGTHLDGG